MTLLSACRDYCTKHSLLSCGTVLVGVSGGADSMCLLDILFSITHDNSQSSGADSYPGILAVHINHGVRGVSADADEELIRAYCAKKDIPFVSGKFDIRKLASEKKMGLEETGRNCRYAFFDEIADQYGSGSGPVRIAVAHHREDQGETILMNLFRGAGPDGLAGMQPMSSNLIRPLLFASKKEILEYAREQGIPYAEDSSNQDNTYVRNRWRNRVFPILQDVCGKDPVTPLLRTAEIFREDQEYFADVIEDLKSRFRKDVTSGIYGMPINLLADSPRALSSRLVRRMYTDTFGAGTDLESVHVSAILALTGDGPGGRKLSLPHGRRCLVSDGYLFFYGKENLCEDTAYGLSPGELLLAHGTSAQIRIEPQTDGLKSIMTIPQTSFELETIAVENPEQVVYNNRTWYCTKSILRDTMLRTRRSDDFFARAGSPGGKPLRRVLTDRKIPVFLRDRLLIAAKGDRVLWIPGLSHGAGFVDGASRQRFNESLGVGPDQIAYPNDILYRIRILDRNEEEQ
jgi:tRNA(Ile)-lysidine synthase